MGCGDQTLIDDERVHQEVFRTTGVL